MADLVINENDNKVLTKDRIDKIRFIQNTSNAQLMIKDLGDKGCVLSPDEIIDLKKFFTKKQIGSSQQLDWCIRENHVSILGWEELKDDDGNPAGIKLTGVKEKKDKFKPKGADLPKNVPVEDRDDNHFDEALDAQEDKEDAEDEDTKVGRKRRSKKKRKDREEEDDEGDD